MLTIIYVIRLLILIISSAKYSTDFPYAFIKAPTVPGNFLVKIIIYWTLFSREDSLEKKGGGNLEVGWLVDRWKWDCPTEPPSICLSWYVQICYLCWVKLRCHTLVSPDRNIRVFLLGVFFYFYSLYQIGLLNVKNTIYIFGP